MKYFAYGSNMSLRRMQQRVPSARSIGTYRLERHDLRFHKIGQDGSGKCDAFFTDDPADTVLGVLYEIAVAEKLVLDKAEDLGVGYGEKRIRVVDENCRVETCSTYYALLIETSLLPFHWYRDHVLIGAREAVLPIEYIGKIETIETIDDPDAGRARVQRSIHKK